MVGRTAFNFSPIPEDSTLTLDLNHDPIRPSSSPSVKRRKVGSWLRRSPVERIPIAIVILVALVIISLLLIGAFTPDGGPPDVCLTPGCVEAASSIIAAMDLQADPCDDFYQYACGGWIRRNPLPEGNSDWGTMKKLGDENRLIMKSILEDSSNSRISHAEKLVKTYYSSCVDTNGTIEKLGIAPIEDLLKSLGGWNPAARAFDPSKWELQEIIEKAQNVHGTRVFFDWSITPVSKNSSRLTIALDRGGLTKFWRDYYFDATRNKTDALLAYYERLGMLMGGTNETARAQANRVFEFERDLAKIFVNGKDPSPVSKRIALTELRSESPFLDWLSFFRKTFDQMNVTVNPDTEVIVRSRGFFRKLSNLINDTLAKPKGKTILADYVEFRTIHSHVAVLPAKFRDALHAMNRVFLGIEGAQAPKRDCLSDTHQKLGLVFTSMFIKQAFDKRSKQNIQSMADRIKTAFKENLLHAKWMDDTTRAAEEGKVDRLTDSIAFPDVLTDTENLDEAYIGLELKDNAYFGNNIEISQWILKQTLKKLDTAVRREGWEMSPLEASARYARWKHRIEIPAGILRAPFYHNEFPSSWNFGTIGFIIGHELTHGFGNIGNMNRWTQNETISECLIDQYSQYAIDNEHINGDKTLGENIADNAGLKVAFDAYRSWAKNNRELLPLPGVNLTHEQLFYVGFAYLLCSIETPDYRRKHLLTNVHSPRKYRVLVTLSNSVDFAEAYHCAAPSKMNPKKKCELF